MRNDEKKSEEVAGDRDGGWTGGHFRSVTTLLSLILFASILNVKAQDTRPDEQSMNSLLEEVRRMRQTIERLEARVNKFEAEKGEAAAKQAPAPNETNQVRGAAVSAGSSITEAAGKNASAPAQTATLSAGDRVTAQLNYYFGREQRVRTSILNPTFPVLPTQPGLSPVEIRPAPDGRLHILDAYATLSLTDKLTFAFEGDYVVNRFFENSPPSRVTGGVAYARYQFSPRFAVAGRFEYLSDRGGLFSGVTQALKEHTLTAEYKFGEGFLMRGEYRRDYSNQPFFLTETPGALKREQNTATLGLVWWWGRKEGVW